eukprot:c7287_g1_i1.p1 GENE.c7287_g1_i1~~c7287_g1_i1.p1  ORF type:complete len:420 (-),score=73.92 c7287_g1_i1:11-1270(-)
MDTDRKTPSTSVRAALRALDDLDDMVTERIREPRDRLMALLKEHDGRLSETLRTEFKRSATELTERIRAKFEDNVAKKRKELRKRITGEETKRLRDHWREKRQQPPVMRLLDKIAFTAGVLNMMVSEFILLKAPEWFWLYYLAVMPALFCVKYVTYQRLRWQYFLIDFCYFGNLSCILQLLLFPPQSVLSQINFCISNGPLAFAIPVWHNSLVFHDVDRTSSTCIHLFPVLLTFALRWYPSAQTPQFLGPYYVPADQAEEQSLGFSHVMLGLLFYSMWQLLYLLKTEVLDRAKFEADPTLQSSLIWMASDTKNPTANFVLMVMRKIGYFAPTERYNSRELKTKMVFVGAQFVYTFFCFLPTPLLYRYFWAHCLFVLWLVGVVVHNGASYYIEVFSRRYAQQFAAVDREWTKRGEKQDQQ